MVHLVADDDTPLSILGDVYEPVVVYDSTGTTVIGHFTPIDLEKGRRIYAELAKRCDPEELARRAAAPGPRRLLSETIKELEELYPVDSSGPPAPQPVDLPRSGECASR
jgi:hypothetical protein